VRGIDVGAWAGGRELSASVAVSGVAASAVLDSPVLGLPGVKVDAGRIKSDA
jgi:hypothetical protein